MQPKKYLGQNFLRDQAALEKIIQAAGLGPEDNVIEIGPGTGALTKELIKKLPKGKLIAIEKDGKLAEALARDFQFIIYNPPSILNGSIFKSNNHGVIISGDVLKINLPNLIENSFFQSANHDLQPTSYKVVANIPYYITSPIIQLFLEMELPPQEMVLMVQKEVAERICASPREMSILAASVQYYAMPELLFYVSKKSFWPIPEVDSAVIRISPNMQPITKKEKDAYFRIVHAGFASKRKTLLNNLSNSFHASKMEVAEKIKKAGLKPSQRAQELGVSDWKKLAALFT